MTLIEDRNDPRYCKLPHMDGRCGARWGKQVEAHCYTCHETLNGVEEWDAHMPNGICQGPASAGLVLVAHRVYRVWGFPSSDELPLAWR